MHEKLILTFTIAIANWDLLLAIAIAQLAIAIAIHTHICMATKWQLIITGIEMGNKTKRNRSDFHCSTLNCDRI